MLLHFALCLSLLLVSVVIAFPSSQSPPRRHERRQVNDRLRLSTASQGMYSLNWAGGVWSKPNGTFTSVTGTFVVPMLSGQSGSAASAWVGIDGDTCTNAMLQTGVDFVLSNDGQVTYTAWYEWYPAPFYNFTSVDIAAGDVVRLTVVAYSTTTGSAMVENLTNGQIGFECLNSTAALCEQDAGWIVQDFGPTGNPAPLANFSMVMFTDAGAIESTGATLAPFGAGALNIKQNDKVLTSVWMSGSSIAVQYL